jgi:hypothetical protein
MTQTPLVGHAGAQAPASISLFTRFTDRKRLIQLLTYIALIILMLALLPLVKGEWTCKEINPVQHVTNCTWHEDGDIVNQEIIVAQLDSDTEDPGVSGVSYPGVLQFLYNFIQWLMG